VVTVTANGKPVSTMHELAHVVQQRQCEIALTLSPSNQKQKTIIGGFKTMSGMDSETDVIDLSTPGSRVSLAAFVVPQSNAPSWYPPGATKYPVVKLSRG
jgi:hypothetical protein